MKAEYRTRLPGMPEIAQKLRLSRELLQNQIEIFDLKDLPLATHSIQDFEAKYCESNESQTWLWTLMDARPDIKLASFGPAPRLGLIRRLPALYLPPSHDNPFGQITVLQPNTIDELRFDDTANQLIAMPQIESAYELRCERLFIVNRQKKAVEIGALAPFALQTTARLANWLPRPEDQERWEKTNFYFGANLSDQRITHAEIRRKRDVESVSHELGHLWAASLELDPNSEDEYLARNQAEDLCLDPGGLEYALQVPAINAIQEIFHSERLASIIGRIIQSRLEQAGFLEKDRANNLERMLQSYDSIRARYILENYPREAADLFASRWARSRKGIEQSQQILRATTALERSTLARIRALGPPDKTEDWRPEMNTLLQSWSDPGKVFAAFIYRKANETFAEASICWYDRKDPHHRGMAVNFGYLSGFQLLEWQDQRDQNVLKRVIAGEENPHFREDLAKMAKFVDAVLTKIEQGRA